jgi:predicted hydrolase (HD superfamily)
MEDKMKTIITMEEARNLLKKYIKQEYILAHSKETETVNAIKEIVSEIGF